MFGSSFLRYIIYFLILNLIINYAFRISPLLGFLAFGAFIYYSMFRRMGHQRMWGSTQFRTYNTGQSTQQTYDQPKETFKKDPNVIDAEYHEHKTH